MGFESRMQLLAKISTVSLNSKACPSVRYFRYTNNNMPSLIQSSKYHARNGSLNYTDEAGPDSYNSASFPSSHVQASANKATSNNQRNHYSSKSNLQDYAHSSKISSPESYPSLKPEGLEHWFKNWQEQRKHKLTASTFGSAIGFWPHRRVQLWLEKINLIVPFSGNLATWWSNSKEEDALKQYKLITGNSIYVPEFLVYNRTNPRDDWLAASPDGVVEHCAYGLPNGGVLEVKCPSQNGEAGQVFPWKRIPLYLMPQAQGLLEILDRNWMDFYVWTPNGSNLFRIERNHQYWELLYLALSDFWWKHVQPAKELCRMDPITDHFTLVESLQPAPRHELCREIICASRHLVDESRLLVKEIHGKLQN